MDSEDEEFSHFPECEWSKDDGQCHSYIGWDKTVYDYHRDKSENGICSRCYATCYCAIITAHRDRIRTKILEHYSTAPKAANPLLKRLGMEEV